MRLKLFRSTGYASLFGPGETRSALHPGWVVLAASLWIGLACNAPLWSALLASPLAMPRPAALALLAGGFTAAMLGLLAWGNALKLMLCLLLLAAAALALGGLGQAAPALPWKLGATVAVLALLPLGWLGRVPVKRLSGRRQLRMNLLCLVLGLGAAVAGLAVLAPAVLAAWGWVGRT